MRSLYDFIVKPLGEEYDNEITIGDKKLVLNTKIESFKFVNNVAEVVEIPAAFNTPVKKGDLIIIHHNVFRVFYDMKGIKKNSRSFLKDGLFFCSTDQVYLYKRADTWKSFGDRCFVAPVKNKDVLSSEKTTNLIGILKIGNSSLESSGINPGDIIGFTPNSEWEFVIDDQIMYCMKSNDIVIKYGSDRNEEEYNSRWAQGN